ncbi:MAG: uroporphyrinogen-III C-methyltransferase [Candidatus Sedimenticola sp. (ex Thyasira tokunagai)]
MNKTRNNPTGQSGPSAEADADAEIVDAEILESTPSPRAGAPGGGSVPRVAMALSLIAVVAVVAGLGYGYQRWNGMQASLLQMDKSIADAARQTTELQSRLDQTHQAFESQKAEMEKQNSRLSEQDDKLATERQALDKKAGEIEETLERVYRRVGRNSSAWMAAEAEYLMQVANHRLQLEDDVATAISALQAADQRLLETGDPGWTATRELLASEIAALKSAGVIDQVGLSAKLAGMAGQIKSLKMVGLRPSVASGKPLESRPVEASERNLNTLLKDGWEGFKSVMVVRRHDKPVTAMLPPEQYYFVYRNLELQLESARLSLLQRNQALYDGSLETAEHWLREFFDAEASGTAAMLQQLNEMQRVRVKPELPDITRALERLRQRLQQGSEEAARQ